MDRVKINKQWLTGDHATLSYDPDKKAGLPAGPWQVEPDKATWYDPATGMACMIVRGPMGALCGYVAVDPDHPWHGTGYGDPVPGAAIDPDDDDWSARYDHSPEAKVSVHGGLTYSAACHGDICHVPAPGRPHDVWWFGFDCAHYMDLVPKMVAFNAEHGLTHLPETETYKDFDYVTAAVRDLAAQLNGVTR